MSQSTQPVVVSIQAEAMEGGSWYLTSTSHPGFRYILHWSDDMARGLRLVTEMKSEVS